MESLYINNIGDIELDNLGNLKMIDGNKEIAQRNEIIVSTNQGEWIFDKLFGVPWIEMMSEKGTTNEEFKKEIINELNKDDDIESIVEINVEKDNINRHIEIDFRAKLKNGETISGEIEV